MTDYYEKLYDDSLESLTTRSILPGTASLLTTSPTILNTPNSSSNSNVFLNAAANVKKSPPIVLKISTRKLEIVSSIKIQIAENELCSVLFLYLVIVCIEINDWINLRVLLPAVRYPENNNSLFEKWFLYSFFNMLHEKATVEQFKQDWFVTLIFDEFLFVLLQQKESLLSSPASPQPSHLLVNSNNLYDQIFKLIDKIYPAYLLPVHFFRLIEKIKPKKSVIT